MKKILYLGLHPPKDPQKGIYTHCPLIQINPRSPDEEQIKIAFEELSNYTHILFTSKNSIRIFFKYLSFFKKSVLDVLDKKILSIGRESTLDIESYGISVYLTAKTETSEGLLNELYHISPNSAYLFWPHSSRSRPVLNEGIESLHIRYREAIFYDTTTLVPKSKPNIFEYDEILFTSPSTVDAFFEIFGSPPKDVELATIGPVTGAYLEMMLKKMHF